MIMKPKSPLVWIGLVCHYQEEKTFKIAPFNIQSSITYIRGPPCPTPCVYPHHFPTRSLFEFQNRSDKNKMITRSHTTGPQHHTNHIPSAIYLANSFYYSAYYYLRNFFYLDSSFFLV